MKNVLSTYSLRPDSTLKSFFRSQSRLADMINSVCFGGQTVLLDNDLSSQDTDLSQVFDFTDEPISFNSYRDVIMKANQNGIYIIVALENQKGLDYHMPLRTFLYDAYSYKIQHQEYLHEKKRNGKAQLKLVPVFTAVIYFGEQKWKGPKSLLDMMVIPEKFKGLVNNWDINLIELKNIDAGLFRNQDNRDLVEGLQMIYRCEGDYSELKERYISKETALTLGALVDQDKELVEIIVDEKEEKVNMCQSIDKMRAQARREGELQGIKQGITKGITQGMTKGIIQGKIVLIVEQLKCKLGNLSIETQKAIEKSTNEQLDQLSIEVFNICSEEDIIQILIKDEGLKSSF